MPGAGHARVAAGALSLVALVVGVRLIRAATDREAPVRGGAAPRAGPAALPLALVAAAGLGTGTREGAAARRACTTALEDGAAVTVAGATRDRVAALPRDPGSPPDRPGAVARRRADIRLARASLVAGGRRCTVRDLRVRVDRDRDPIDPGTGLLITGTWRAFGSDGLPRPPDRYGVLVARAVSIAYADAPGWHDRARGRLAARLDERLPERAASIARPLALADRTTLDWNTRQRFVDAGIVHLLAISGLHVGMIAGTLLWLIGLRRRGPRRWVIAAVAIAAYVALIGAPPAAVRASLVFGGHAACRVRGRPARTGDLGGLAALTALALDPLLVTDPGFQLSCAGFAGVVTGHRLGSTARVGRRPRRLVAAATASVGAFLATAPLAAVHFGRVVPTSIPASMASTGLVGLLLPAVVATALLPGWVAGAIAPAAAVLAIGLDELAGRFAGWPLRWDVTPWGAWALAAAAILSVSVGLVRRPRRWRFGVALAGLAAVWLARPVLERAVGRGTALVCSLAVGQGDAAVVRTGRGRWLVLDAGPGSSILDGAPLAGAGPPLAAGAGDAGRRVIVPFLRARGAREIELLAVSHPHLDHFGGSGALFDAFRIRRVLDPGYLEPSAPYAAFLGRVREETAHWIRAERGMAIRVDDVSLEVLSPRGRADRAPRVEAPGDANEASLALRLAVGAFRYLNTGDAPMVVERRILARGGPGELEADLLKLGHHGSRTSSALEWLEAVDPALVLISAGRDNRYGHPHSQTLARLDSAGVARRWRTDRDGSLCIAIDGDGWRIIEP